MRRRPETTKAAEPLQEPAEEARNLALKLGLEPYDVNYWIVDYDEMNELIAYNGFQERYPHWRWGMQYDRQQKQGQYTGGKAFEIVINDDPSHAFLQESNDLADQKAVITHVEAHSDFFANNRWYGMFAEDLDAAAMLERHARRIEEYMADPEIDREEVEQWIDSVLCLEDNIDQHEPFKRQYEREDAEEIDDDELAEKLEEMDLSEEVVQQVFDEEFLDEQQEAAELDEPEKDVLAFLRDHGKAFDEESEKAEEMTEWQQEILEMLRAESYYFAAQKLTKVMNEGWACVAPETPVFTADGLVPMREVVETQPSVSDGEQTRNVYDTNIIPDHDIVSIETRRGFELTGSNNHRVRRPDGSWVRLDELDEGDEIEISGGNGVWPEEYAGVQWQNPEYVTLEDVAEEAGVSVWTVMRYRKTGHAEKADAIEQALTRYDGDDRSAAYRDSIRVPDAVNERFGRFLGLVVGDGHVSTDPRHVGFTTATKAHAEEFAGLTDELFGLEPTVEKQGSRWRVYAYSENLKELLVETFGLPVGKAASEKTVPDQILQSPRSVVAEFIRGLMDADGYAGEQGAILSTKSEDVSSTVQLLLTNFGILSRRREQTDGCYHLHLTGRSAKRFADEIGFGYPDKADALATYLDELSRFENESWTDEIVAVEEGSGPVYDISVEETHRYAGSGFVNHNSYWQSTMMDGEAFAGDNEFIQHADHISKVLNSPGLNPYQLGKELWVYIENTENRREVCRKLLRVEGVTWRNFHDRIDFERVQELLEPDPRIDAVDPDGLDELDDLAPEKVDPDALQRAEDGEIDVERHPWKLLTYEGLAERHFSLCKPQNRGFVRSVSQTDLEHYTRYIVDSARYGSVEEALADVEYTTGWDEMREVRASNNDVTFLDSYLTQEFVTDNEYFTYEFSQTTGDYRVASTDYEDVKKKLMLQFTNFGKPTIAVYDGNYNNRNELLLGHHYNGVMLDIEQAKRTLERTFDLWGRPVNLKTIVKEVDDRDAEIARRRDKEPDPEEVGKLLRYDGEQFEMRDLDWSEVENIAADEIDYDTKPDDWLA
ncbi:SpoVR family protein [Halobacteriales archaeon QS_1_67_19]|nr:MAG: SpoVR family protein [Halobacteriales archaeon QS_1_67_19]